MTVRYRGEELRCPACGHALELGHMARDSTHPVTGQTFTAGEPVIYCACHGCPYIAAVRLPESPEVAAHRARLES